MTTVFKITNFIFIVLPDIIPRNGIAILTQTRNGTVTIYFDITAQPHVDPSDIQWYFQFSVEDFVTIPNKTKKYMFSANQHSLTISDVQLSDAGTYRIEAENIVGSNIAEVTLFVYGMLNYFKIMISCRKNIFVIVSKQPIFTKIEFITKRYICIQNVYIQDCH